MNKRQQKQPAYSPEREDRVAAALRENLRKRKQQVQARVLSDLENKDTE